MKKRHLQKKLPGEQRGHAGRKTAILMLSVFLLIGCSVCVSADVRAEETAAAEENGMNDGSDENQAEGRKQLKITVVEDIPAVEIEESDVPLAAFPNTQARNGIRHVLWMGALLIAVIAYTAYFSMFDRRLSGLRREAARREKRLMDLRRTGIPEEKHER